MIKKLRRKFVLYSMCVAAIILIVAFGAVYAMTSNNMERDSLRLLRLAVSENMLVEYSDSSVDLRLPYFTLDVTDTGEIYILLSTYDTLNDDDMITDIVSASTKSDAESGVLPEYDLRYYRLRLDDGWRIAFADMTAENNTMRNLVKNSLIISTATLAVFFFISLLLSYWVAKPVKDAWDRQRRFVADASHELKTPLTVILANADMLLSGAQDETPLRRWGENIKVESERMKNLVEEMLTLARADNTTDKPESITVDFSDVVTNTVLLFEPIVYETGRILEYAVDEGLYTSGVESELRQLVEILLDNAVKYSNDGATIWVRLTSGSAKSLLLSVENEGPEIPGDDLDRIFQRFYRVDPARSGAGGFGLGLSIASTIVEGAGGQMWAESDSGVNSFLVSLPASKQASHV